MKIKFFLIYFFAVFISQIYSPAYAQSAADAPKGWRVINTEHSTIFCHPQVDLKKVNSKIRIRFYDIELDKRHYSQIDDSDAGELARKFDQLFAKVQKILDMYPRRMKLEVRVYKTQAQLDDAYAEIFGNFNRQRMISFYIHKYQTIYTTQQAIRQGVLAHEMAHAVVDHYFLIRPPESVREILSQYVEMHLED